MAIQLNQPLRWKSANAEETLLLQDLQGNILKGHGRGHTAHVFITFKSAAGGKSACHAIAPSLTPALAQLNAAKVFKQGGPSAGQFVAFMVSAAGYAAMNVVATKRPTDPQFIAGMKASQGTLHDTLPAAWDNPFKGTIHAMLLVADVSVALVTAGVAELVSLLGPGISVVGTEVGDQQFSTHDGKHKEGVEHFGYVDGRSQPLLLVEDLENEDDTMGGRSLWEAAFPLSTALVKSPGSPATSFGSYFVFRKLEQNVKAFKDDEEALAALLGLQGDDAERAGAMAVGRFEDGTPLVLTKDAEDFHPVWNNFNYDDDPNALRCPFQAHTRKMNPRGESAVKLANLGVTLADERGHIMVRRGITYGERAADLKDKPEDGVGLLFMAYQNNIANQFEFVQSSWANAPCFVAPGTGLDPVIAQGAAPGGQSWRPAYNDATSAPVAFDFGKHVKLKGGEYFFAPCVSFLATV